jgi:hypothetical protein
MIQTGEISAKAGTALLEPDLVLAYGDTNFMTE